MGIGFLNIKIYIYIHLKNTDLCLKVISALNNYGGNNHVSESSSPSVSQCVGQLVSERVSQSTISS